MNDVGEGPLSPEISSYAMSLPGQPQAPFLVNSLEVAGTSATVTVGWYALIETGGVPLTGYKLYQMDLSTNTQALAYDGTSMPQVT